MNRPEILAPGGGFNSSIHAFEAGADAVYAGMSSFSARKGATNFTIEQLRRLKSYATEKNKKIYIALNTVIRQSEMEEVIALLHRLSEIRVNGIILQDVGLAYIIKKYFPGLEFHASTQMAAHNSRGVDALKKAGFSRIILARELTLNEMQKIRMEHRDVELEVFIHGAMCYSFSGICLASGRLLGRSGNRGECGQICRTWFDGRDKHRYAFSANDMKAGEAVRDIAAIGIDSLKIEGRLKSPEYVSHTVAYYRKLLEGGDKTETSIEEELSSVAFSRNQTSAFFHSEKGRAMIDNRYASHRGIPAGKVVSSRKGQFTLKSMIDLSVRDGLLLFLKGEPQQFALKSASKKNRFRKGDTVSVIFNRPVAEGTEVFLVSRHDMQLKEYKEESRRPWKTPINLSVSLNEKELSVVTQIAGRVFQYNEKLSIEDSKGDKDIKSIISDSFSKSGESQYKSRSIEIENSTGKPDNGIFIAPSILKKIRQNFFFNLESEVEAFYRDTGQNILNEITGDFTGLEYTEWQMKIPDRKDMGPSDSLIPFGPGSGRYYPLPPLQFSDMDFETIVTEIESMLKKSDDPIILGINNVGHLHLAEKYRENKNVFFFTDYCAYTANHAAGLFYKEIIDRLIFSYHWIEDTEPPLPSFRSIEEDFNPHLFVSRICYRLHNNYGSCKNCRRDYIYDLKQRDRDFSVVVKDCLTWLFQKR